MNRERAKIIVRGAVQGVGFRPFVYRLATELALHGCVHNSGEGVFIEVEGSRTFLDEFLRRLGEEMPPLAVVQSLESSFLDPANYSRFEIRESDESGAKTALILPDIATCADCLREVFDSADRRSRYPFTNCTNCGPRFSIIEGLPYDRVATSMRRFRMCAECEREYHDPRDRRFHAQPNACPLCGPKLELWNCEGELLASGDQALERAAEAVRGGQILALKGLGGFQLIVDAADEQSVVRLRERKGREEKPFALMVESRAAAHEICLLSEQEERLLESPAGPIVLLERKPGLSLALGLAPGNPNLGLMLPSTPLHHLLLHSLGRPVVATSGNRSDEPICIDEREAIERLHGIADLFLVHDRPIVRQMDDSIARVMAGREMILRRARGYAPLPFHFREPLPSILALGAHFKNTTALSVGANVFVSQHLGNLETPQAYAAFVKSADDLPRLYQTHPTTIAHDLHPEYLSTKHALELPGKKAPVQHHWAHVAGCMAENEIEAPALGVAWDGTGYGLDGTIWGGEFLLAQSDGSFERVAHLRTFALPGGDRAIQEPRRCALGVLHQIFGDETWKRPEVKAAFASKDIALLRQMLDREIRSPRTSSAGRLFDAAAALIGLRTRTSFEGQAAMELEFAADPAIREAYPFELRETNPIVIDWEPAIRALLSDIERGCPQSALSAKFHNMLSESIVVVAHKVGEPKIVLSGGCWQNRYLLERTIARLREAGFQPYWHQRVPPNDGGIAFGQIAALRALRS
ncbi:MAG: carbamoyltransferase HypF [Chthoniobacterales bacterium]